MKTVGDDSPTTDHQPRQPHEPLISVVAIALGSNLGDRLAHLDHAIFRLKEWLSDARVSRAMETDPVGVPDQPTFLNAAMVGAFRGTPRELLSALMKVEQERGRERPQPGAARTLDLDLVLFGNRMVDEPGLTVPHPRFRTRAFVLQPLADIASDLVDPVTGLTVGELWKKVQRSKCDL